MSDIKRSVFIVSAFGRGHWLAVQCKALGLDVTLFDVSSRLGQWAAEDAEGPFGFFRDESLPESLIERILADEVFDSVDSGFTVLLPEGPVEFKSPITQYRLKQMGVPEQTMEFLQKAHFSWPQLEKLSFSELWPLHLSCDFTTSQWSPSAVAAKRSISTPLSSGYFVKSATRLGLERSLQWLQAKGVEVVLDTELLDVSLSDKKSFGGIELKGKISGLVKADQLLWCLTSEESYYYNERLAEKLLKTPAQESAWCWIRYQLKFEDCPQYRSLPLHFLMIKDLNSPWTHENFLVVQKTRANLVSDVWMRIPSVQRFNKDYLNQMGEKILHRFQFQLDRFRAEITHYPQEYNYTYNQLGPSRYPIYDGGVDIGVEYRNVFRSSPENWGAYSWTSRHQHESKIISSISQWWTELKEKEAKRLAKLNKEGRP